MQNSVCKLFEPDSYDGICDGYEGEDNRDGAPCYQLFKVNETIKNEENIRETVATLDPELEV